MGVDITQNAEVRHCLLAIRLHKDIRRVNGYSEMMSLIEEEIDDEIKFFKRTIDGADYKTQEDFTNAFSEWVHGRSLSERSIQRLRQLMNLFSPEYITALAAVLSSVGKALRVTDLHEPSAEWVVIHLDTEPE